MNEMIDPAKMNNSHLFDRLKNVINGVKQLFTVDSSKASTILLRIGLLSVEACDAGELTPDQFKELSVIMEKIADEYMGDPVYDFHY